MSFRAPRPAGCRVLWLKAEPEAVGIPGSALHRSPGMAEAALAHLELSPTRSTAAVGGGEKRGGMVGGGGCGVGLRGRAEQCGKSSERIQSERRLRAGEGGGSAGRGCALLRVYRPQQWAQVERSESQRHAGNAEPSSASVVQLRVLCCSTAPSWAAWSRCRWAAVGSLQQQPQCCVL